MTGGDGGGGGSNMGLQCPISLPHTIKVSNTENASL